MSSVKELFGVNATEELFDEKKYPSMNKEERCTPAFMCPEGIKRMAKEFKSFPVQYKVNIDYLRKQNDEFMTAVSILEQEYNSL